MKFIVALLLLLTISTPALAADHTAEVLDRKYTVYVPDALEGQENLPVVLLLHGGGGNAAQMRQMTGFDAVADRHKFIAVYPEGTGINLLGKKILTWNAGLCCGASVKKNVDDTGFLAAVIDDVVKTYHADAHRVYATGHSNGGMMSYRLACEVPEKLAAIAPNASTNVFSPCNPARHVPVLDIHGTADPCVPYNGGESCGGCFSKILGDHFHLSGDHWPCGSTPEGVKAEAKAAGCGLETETVFQRGSVTCIRYNCPVGSGVGLCSIAGAGHRWAGSTDIGGAGCAKDPDRKMCTRYGDITGPLNSDVDAGELAWIFFKDFKIP